MAGETLDLFHPLVRRWFAERFAAPTDAQARAWPVIARGEHVLVSAPTGSGQAPHSGTSHTAATASNLPKEHRCRRAEACRRPSPSTAAPRSTTGSRTYRATWCRRRESSNSNPRTRIRTASSYSYRTTRATRTGTASTGSCPALRVEAPPRMSSARTWERVERVALAGPAAQREALPAAVAAQARAVAAAAVAVAAAQRAQVPVAVVEPAVAAAADLQVARVVLLPGAAAAQADPAAPPAQASTARPRRGAHATSDDPRVAPRPSDGCSPSGSYSGAERGIAGPADRFAAQIDGGQMNLHGRCVQNVRPRPRPRLRPRPPFVALPDEQFRLGRRPPPQRPAASLACRGITGCQVRPRLTADGRRSPDRARASWLRSRRLCACPPAVRGSRSARPACRFVRDRGPEAGG
jgi:hypothetical protein